MDQQLFQKYLQQQCSPAERDYVISCLEKDPGLIERFLPEEEWTNAGIQPLTAPNAASIFARIKPRRMIRFRNWTSLAAILAYAVLSAVVVQYLIPEKRIQHPVQARNMVSPEIKFHHTGNTARLIRLDDGSLVKLSPNSSLQYQQPFPSHARHLTLTGAATFDVAPDQKRPFTVSGQGINTTALGTSFRVIAWERRKVEVRLFHGKVRVSAQPGLTQKVFPDMVLYPGQQFRYDGRLAKLSRFDQTRKTQLAVVKDKPMPVTPVPMIGGTLEFDKTPLAQACAELSSRYGKVIQCGQVRKVILLTAQFSEHDQLKDILNKIAALNQLNLTILKDGSYLFTEESAAPEHQ
ncbi:FecR family protein [Pedobacter caeni]|uniref:FecR family protein n=1 Tax=Pedobacter caeni TaxID=288992 RepID=A0A1M5PRX3_9SPHI|nr:FecR family protein [Pedobacter caeni]SHH04534.1 FecR family protein [Pedobacter caeni]